jgi:hypothetical protein
MTIVANNKLLQTSIDYISQDQNGSLVQDRESLSWDIDSAVASTVVFKAGYFVELGANKGAQAVAASTPASGLLGVVKYQISGVIDAAGYPASLYTNIPVLKNGIILVPAATTVDVDAVPFLVVDPAQTATYGKILNGSGTGAIDISAFSKVVKKTNSNGYCELDINII